MNSFSAQIIGAAAGGALVLTANKRLARHLRAAYDARMQNEGRSVWQSPRIISYEAWLHRCLAEMGEGWRLLDGLPALRLWEELIEQSSAGTDLELLQIPATARRAHEAHRMLVEYGCRLDGANLIDDQRIFRQWRSDFQKACRDKMWLDRADLPRYLFRALSEGRLAAPSQAIIAGFDRWSPEFDELKRTIEQSGGTLREILPEPDTSAKVRRVPCVDAANEVEMAARWARQLLEKGAVSIGIVVLDLHARRSRIERVFRDQIDPGAALNPGSAESSFTLSLGEPLSSQGPVNSALAILSCDHRVSLEKASFLLRTPYLSGSRSEADRRALFDRKLRSFRQQGLSRKQFERMAADAAPNFAALLSKLADKKMSRCLPGEWAGRFDRLLRDVGWPGERALSSREFQAVKAWREKLLPAMASLDPVSGAMEAGAALTLLRRLAGEIEFQVEAQAGPLQVVGLLESAGLEFDHLWVMGMNEEAFPAPSRPNPFLPLPLQIEKGMPHASAARELSFARRVLGRLLAASPDIVFSYAERRGDCELRPSPLLERFEEAGVPMAESMEPKLQMIDSRSALNEDADSRGPELTEMLAGGGTGILKDQSLCPFRAFAHHRLQCQALDSPQPGLDPLTRGNLLHKALENLWGDLRGSDRLQDLSEERSSEILQRHVDAALDEYFANRPTPEARLLELERQRLLALIGEWLEEVERQRPAFTVEQIEQEHIEQIGPLKIRTVVDRIDRLADGSRVILDYKTGRVKADKLLGERLLEPQLPIYAVAEAEREADAVAFARVRRGECGLVGVARHNDLLPKVAAVSDSKQAQDLGVDDWPQLLKHWRNQLERLAGDFAAGAAAVDPVSYEDACQYCDLPGFCRISEQQCEGEER